MECRHAAIVGGRCLTCGATVNGGNGANKAVQPQGEQIPTAAATPPENGQETPKKTTRKRKA
jgi:hypothetical protein